ncbi:hypothetical protein [Paenibacillus gansuensis]|uniref:Tissue inhibitor of metalloproteinase n=1 Tax=Paenibacillus gansuensis TaxID=306542 RepID=A0ABW5PI69_9BACL
MKISVFFAAILFLFSLVILPINKAYACSCAELEPKEAFEKAESVFTGRVLSSKQQRIQNGVMGAIENRDVNLLEVQETWKGVNQSQVIVYDNGHEASCGFHFSVGSTYLVYTYKGKDGERYTSFCSRTNEVSKAGEDLKFLGQGKPAEKEVNLEGELKRISNKDYDMEIFIVGIVVVGAVTFFVVRKVRRKS